MSGKRILQPPVLRAEIGRLHDDESEGPHNRICPACSDGIKYGGMGTAIDLGRGRFSRGSPVSGAIMGRTT
jgi:hypothetical protein